MGGREERGSVDGAAEAAAAVPGDTAWWHRTDGTDPALR